MKHKDKLLDIREHLDNALHQAISIERIREETETAYELVDSLVEDEPQLTDNQQIVLNWLKEKTTKKSRGHSFEFALWWLLDDFGTDELSNPTTTLFAKMNDKQRKEVLAGFIAWAQEQEEAW